VESLESIFDGSSSVLKEDSPPSPSSPLSNPYPQSPVNLKRLDIGEDVSQSSGLIPRRHSKWSTPAKLGFPSHSPGFLLTHFELETLAPAASYPSHTIRNCRERERERGGESARAAFKEDAQIVKHCVPAAVCLRVSPPASYLRHGPPDHGDPQEKQEAASALVVRQWSVRSSSEETAKPTPSRWRRVLATLTRLNTFSDCIVARTSTANPPPVVVNTESLDSAPYKSLFVLGHLYKGGDITVCS
ncbi:hypothetical protein DNTS_024675, partial [Danionella cerebrum]